MAEKKTWSWGKASTLPDKDMRCERCDSSVSYYKVVDARRLGNSVLCGPCFMQLRDGQ